METGRKGLVGPDPGTLSPEQLEQLRDFKIQTRIANEKYLRTHKEVSLLISSFFREMFLRRPENILEFAAWSSGGPRAVLPFLWVSELCGPSPVVGAFRILIKSRPAGLLSYFHLKGGELWA
ncbi:RIIa domain-containing protein 1 isoform X2 [Rattus norvegicus]|uniref:RIIa domain-containing protein 1 isoform X2 n=1 Tax=Rattus norvegicus TaxID=10116 RepID=UPI0003D0A3CE|nr:RIIa domain-containing protein 1 isoform X1 [Rattus norvegicus]XP_038957467.1 RIIa domain-containing protein 1 isoform X1 [Rattus norvegicus]|eukprot:XP_006232909.1 PREDICTED: RIIa domain-containing protein 1 isoform X1 [Rattus norvegicus]